MIQKDLYTKISAYPSNYENTDVVLDEKLYQKWFKINDFLLAVINLPEAIFLITQNHLFSEFLLKPCNI